MRSFRPIAVILAWLLCLSVTAWSCARFLRGTDAALYNLFVRSPQAEVALLFPGEKLPTQRVLLPHHSPVYPTVYSILWENTSPSDAMDDSCLLRELSTILHCLTTQRHVQVVGISAAPKWADADDPTVRNMFHHSLGEIRHLRLGLQTTDSSHSLPIPEDILPLAIPRENIEGDTSQLPTANSYTPPDSIPDETQYPFNLAPDFVRNELFSHEQARERGLSLPLLMCWNDRIFPTLPLQLAMDALGLSQKDIKFRPDKSLQIGERILPLDVTGRTPLGSAHAEPLPLSAALSAPPQHAAPDSPAASSPLPGAVIIRPSTATLAIEDRGSLLAATLSLLLAKDHVSYLSESRPVKERTLQLTPLQHSLPGLLALAVGCLITLILLPRLTGKVSWLLRSFLFLAGPFVIPVLAVFWYHQGLWMSLCAWILCWLELLAAQEMLRRAYILRTRRGTRRFHYRRRRI